MKTRKIKIIVLLFSFLVTLGLTITMLILSSGKNDTAAEKVEYGAASPEKAVEKMLSAIADHDGMSLESAMFPEKYISKYDDEVRNKYGMSMREFLSENIGSKYDEQRAEVSNINVEYDDPLTDDVIDEMVEKVYKIYGIDLQLEDDVVWLEVRYNVNGIWMYEDPLLLFLYHLNLNLAYFYD